MPVTKSAIKKLRQDRRRESRRDAWRKKVRDILRKSARGEVALPEAYKVIDKSAKMNLFHSNKAARLKSRISQNLQKAS